MVKLYFVLLNVILGVSCVTLTFFLQEGKRATVAASKSATAIFIILFFIFDIVITLFHIVIFLPINVIVV